MVCLLAGSVSAQDVPGAGIFAARLERAAFDLPEGVPNVVVHQGDRGAPERLYVLLHGYGGCAEVLVRSGDTRCGSRGRLLRGWGLGEAFAETASSGWLVVPQLALLARNGSAGRFARDGYFAAFLSELNGAFTDTREDAPMPRADTPITLLAHSAGYEATLAILAHGGVEDRVDRVVLFDALYAGASRFLDWVAADGSRSLVSIHTSRGATARQSQLLASRARARLGETAVADHPATLRQARGARVVVFETSASHGRVPMRHLGDVL